MPSWALFDLNGALLDPRPVASTLPVADRQALVLASLHDAVVQGMVDTLSGQYRPLLGSLPRKRSSCQAAQHPTSKRRAF